MGLVESRTRSITVGASRQELQWSMLQMLSLLSFHTAVKHRKSSNELLYLELPFCSSFFTLLLVKAQFRLTNTDFD